MQNILRNPTESTSWSLNHDLLFSVIRQLANTSEGERLMRWVACDMALLRNDLREPQHYCEEQLVEDLRSVVIDHTGVEIDDWRIADLQRVSQGHMCTGLKHDPRAEMIDEVHKIREALIRTHRTYPKATKVLGKVLFMIRHRIHDMIALYKTLGDRMYLVISDDQDLESSMVANTLEKIKNTIDNGI